MLVAANFAMLKPKVLVIPNSWMSSHMTTGCKTHRPDGDADELDDWLADLRHKGLMAIDQAYGDAWVRLTTRGKRLVQRIWPEAQAMAV